MAGLSSRRSQLIQPKLAVILNSVHQQSNFSVRRREEQRWNLLRWKTEAQFSICVTDFFFSSLFSSLCTRFSRWQNRSTLLLNFETEQMHSQQKCIRHTYMAEKSVCCRQNVKTVFEWIKIANGVASMLGAALIRYLILFMHLFGYHSRSARSSESADI